MEDFINENFDKFKDDLGAQLIPVAWGIAKSMDAWCSPCKDRTGILRFHLPAEHGFHAVYDTFSKFDGGYNFRPHLKGITASNERGELLL